MKHLCLIILLLYSSLATAMQVLDATDQSIALNRPAQRIVSLAPDLTEILYAIGAGAKVVAVSVDTDYPAAAKKLPVVGGYQAINVEAIMALHPDLVVAWVGNPALDIAMLKKLSINVYIVNDQTVSDIAHTMLKLGLLAGVENTASQAAQNFLNQYHALQQQYAHAKAVKVFLEIDDAPLYTLSNKTLQGQIIQLCGGANIFANLSGYAGQVISESVIAANPDVIIGACPINLKHWQQWPQITAVKNSALYEIDGDLLARNGPRLMQGAAQVCQWLAIARHK